MSTKGDTHAPLYDRWLRRVIIRDEKQCWPWLAAIDGGYGVLGAGGKRGGRVYAHRVAYSQAFGPIPDSLTIDHLCRNR